MRHFDALRKLKTRYLHDEQLNSFDKDYTTFALLVRLRLAANLTREDARTPSHPLCRVKPISQCIVISKINKLHNTIIETTNEELWYQVL